MKPRILFLSLFLLLLLGGVERIFACSCVRDTTTCQRYGYSDAIFVGRAVEIKRVRTADSPQLEEEFTVFEAEEMFLGAKKERFSVRNKTGSSCDVEFTPGETYLIFAKGNAKRGFDTALCSGNTPIGYAAELLADLRELPKAGTGGRLYGRTTESVRQRAEGSVPMPGVKIKIQEIGGRKKIYNVSTDREGNYEMILPQGQYKIIPAAPPYAEMGYYTEEPFLVKDRACVEQSFSIYNKSRISGRVTDAEGKPAAGVYVELVASDQIEKPRPFGDDSQVPVEEDGSFSIENVPAGRYTLSVNYAMPVSSENPFPTVFFPNSPLRSGAKVFEIGLGKSIDGLVFRLPPRLVEKTVRGAIVFEDGRPAADVELYLEDAESPGVCVNGCGSETDAEGNFSLKGFANRLYRIKARADAPGDETNEYRLVSEQFSLDENITDLKLTLKKTEKEDR